MLQICAGYSTVRGEISALEVAQRPEDSSRYLFHFACGRCLERLRPGVPLAGHIGQQRLGMPRGMFFFVFF